MALFRLRNNNAKFNLTRSRNTGTVDLIYRYFIS